MKVKRYDGKAWVEINGRVESFLNLFTEEERNSWAGKDNSPPAWVTLGVAYFLGEEPSNKELMRRLAEDD